MRSKRFLAADEATNSFVKRLRNGRGKYWNVLIRVGPRCKAITFLLFPLVIHSKYLKRCADTICDEKWDGSTVTIDLPHFPHGPDIFGMVHDFCCGVKEENIIYTGNVVKLLAASEFLEMESLKDKVWKYLEKKVLNSWRPSVKVLGTFDVTNLPDINVDLNREDCLFGRCMRTFLPRVEGKDAPSMCYNVVNLLRTAKLLPTCVVERICQFLIAEQFRFDAGSFVIYFQPVHGQFDWCSRVAVSRPRPKGEILQKRPSIIVLVRTTNDLTRWMEDLEEALPDLSKRSLLILYLTKLVLPQDQVPTLGRTIRSSEVELGFLCGLLIEASELIATSSDLTPVAPGLVEQIVHLEKSVSWGFHQAATESADRHDLLLAYLIKFRFSTLYSIVTHFRCFCSDPSVVLLLAKILDECLEKHLRDKSFTGNEIFSIYRRFPNKARPSHEELYHVFQIVKGDLSSQEALELMTLLDYEKLSDEIVENLFEEFQLDCGLPFVKRYMALQLTKRGEKEKSDQELIELRSNLSLHIADRLTLETKLKEAHNQAVEREQLRNKSETELKKLRGDLNSMSVAKKLVESERDTLRASRELNQIRQDILRRGLYAEKQKTTCQICFERPRDALCLPCMHFLYCSLCLQQHHDQQIKACSTDRKSKTCPTCRCFASGVLTCNLSG